MGSPSNNPAKKTAKKPKRANGEGTFTKLPSGNVRGRFVDDVDGVLLRSSFTASSETVCKKMHSAWLQSENKVPIERVKTVAEWAAQWLDIYCKAKKLSYSTIKDYTMYVNRHIIPAIGKQRLAAVRPAHIAKLFAEAKNRYDKELSRSARGNLLICLNGIFNTAVENSLCTKNPAEKFGLEEKTVQEFKAFKRSQIVHIINFLNKHEYGVMIAFLLHTGLRIGEFLALTWSDVDLDNKTLHIHRTLTKGEDGETIKDTTKTKRERIVPLDEALEPFIKKLPKDGVFLVCRENGNHHTHRTYERLYKTFFADLNHSLEESKIEQIPYMSPHKCRHTFATYMLRSGANIRAIQAILGHAALKTTEGYAGVDLDDMKSNVSKLSFTS